MKACETLKQKHDEEISVLNSELKQLVEEIKDKNQNINEMCGLIVNNKGLINELQQQMGFLFSYQIRLLFLFFQMKKRNVWDN